MSGAYNNVLKFLRQMVKERCSTVSLIAIATLSIPSAVAISFPASAQTECVLTSGGGNATGSGSFACGDQAGATGANSSAVGPQSSATGTNSVAVGFQA